jgi:hypothetical protein
MADNDNTTPTEQEKHRAELKQSEWVAVLNDDETYSGLDGAWIALSPSGDADRDTDVAVRQIPEDARTDLSGLVMWAINHGYFDETCDGDYLVTFQRKDHPGETYTIHFDRDCAYLEEATEAETIEAAIEEVSHEKLEPHLAGKIGAEPGEPQDDYPNDLNLDPVTITCRRLTANDKMADIKSDMYIG